MVQETKEFILPFYDDLQELLSFVNLNDIHFWRNLEGGGGTVSYMNVNNFLQDQISIHEKKSK